MVGDGQSSSMQEPDLNITARSFIDIPATLLQSEPAGGANGTVLAAVCLLAAVAGWAVWRRKLAQAPREAAGHEERNNRRRGRLTSGFKACGLADRCER